MAVPRELSPYQSPDHDMNARSRNVVLIGMTQNGKSSLVREILKYSGHTERAKLVEVGDGNVSQTQKCTIYPVRIPLQKHFLRSIKTKERVDPTADTRINEVEEQHVLLGRYLDLKVIDTPGLGDSGNFAEHAADADTRFKSSDGRQVPWRIDSKNMKPTDERHKIRIIQAIRDVGTVHAICFIIKGEAFSESLQKMIESVQLIFRSASSSPWDLEYHIIHTGVEVEERFSDHTHTQEREFRTVFVGMRSTHHFLDNKPDTGNPIACHFAKSALASLFSAIVDGIGVHVERLKYAKNSEHRANDKQLCAGIKPLINSYEREIVPLKLELPNAQKRRDFYTDELASREEKLNATIVEIKNLDSDKHVEAGSVTDTASSWGDWSGKELKITSKSVPIVEVTYKPDGDQYWCEKKNTTQYASAKLKSTSILPFFEQEGTMTIWTYRREKERKRLEELRESKARQEDLKITTSSKLQRARAEVITLEEQVSDCAASISRLESAERLTRGDSFSEDMSANDLFFFTTNGVYAAAQGYGMKGKLPKSKLPKMTLNEAKCISEITQKKTEQKDIIDARTLVIAAFQKSIQQKSPLVKDLLSIAEEASHLRNSQKRICDNVESIAFSDPPSGEFTAHISTAQARMKMTARSTTNAVRYALETEDKYLEDNALALTQAYSQVKRSLRNLKDAMAFEIRQKEWSRLWINAADEVISMIREPSLSIGAFVIVDRALGLQIENPYLVLCLEVWEALRAKARV